MQRPDDPEVALAIAYAPAAARAGLTALFALDARLRETTERAREPMIAAIKLAWWREALASERAAAGEPLLDALTRLGIDRAPLAQLAEGWAPVEADALAAHADLRGRTLFEAAARLLGGGEAPVAAAGKGWALADLAARRPVDADEARRLAAPLLQAALSPCWPKPLRPLGMLALLAARDVATGAPRRQGAPGRLLAMARFGLTGR